MRKRPVSRAKRFKARFIRFLIYVAVAGLLVNYLRPLPHALTSIQAFTNTTESIHLTWPAHGSAAIGAKGFGILGSHGPQDVRPMASIAKLITVLAVLERHPLASGQQGPMLTMNTTDVELFNAYYAAGGSYVKVELGEKISLYQALQAILLPSANNMADSLAIWSFGSIENYIGYANNMLKDMHMTRTKVTDDASGMSASSVSTPTDLITLGNIALEHPVIAGIISQPSAIIPVHGTIYSANARFGLTNVIGIKTGLTNQAGGCFLFASKHMAINGKTVTIMGVIMGTPNLKEAILGSEPLLQSAAKHFSIKTPVRAGEVFATLTTPWLETAQIVAKSDLTLLAWNGAPMTPQVKLAPINRSLPEGAQIGTAIIASGANKVSTPLILQKSIRGPSWQWRLKRF